MKINFIYEYFRYDEVECDEQSMIREFLDNAEKILNSGNDDEDEDEDYHISLKNVHCVYLRSKKIEETERLQDYLDDLKKNILLITKSMEKPIESSFNLINLDDYEDFLFIKRPSDIIEIPRDEANCIKATDKITRKEVFIKAYRSNTKNIIDIYKKIRGYSTISTLNHCGLVKVIGFRYPLNEKERKQAQIKSIQVNESGMIVNLTGFIFVFDFVKHFSLLIQNRLYLNSHGFEKNIINPTTRCKIIYGIASMMKCMHNESIMHRNLDIDNVLIDENCEPKLSGFKYAKIIENDLNQTMAIGSPLFMAPEVFMDGDEIYDFAADVYAYGMILYRMFTNKLDFENQMPFQSPQHFMMRIGKGKRPQRPDNMPDCYWDLIQRCWHQDPSNRPTFDEIVEELKSDKYMIEEFGMKTNVDEIHEYQRKVDSFKDKLEMKSITLQQASKYSSPNPVTIVCTLKPDGSTNLATVSWWTYLSYDPCIIGFAMAKTSYSGEMVRQNKKVIVTIPGSENAKLVLDCGSITGRDTDKVKEFGIELQEIGGSQIKIPTHSRLAIICNLKVFHEVGDHYFYICNAEQVFANDNEVPLFAWNGYSQIKPINK